MTSTEPHEYSGARVLVTGASGFIGSHLCRLLVSAGARVSGTCRREPESGPAGVEWHRGDLAEAGTAARIVESVRPDYVFHLASHVAGSRDRALILPTFRDNLATTVHLLDALAGGECRRVVLAGSLEEPEPDGTLQVPSSPYAAAKWAAAGYARMFHALYGVPLVTARIFMVYGPDQKDLNKLIPYVILSLLRGESPRLSAGTREVDWIYVEDLAQGLVALGTAPGVEGQRVDLGSGELVTVRRVVELLGECVDSRVALGFGDLDDRPLEQVRKANVEQTAARLGWRPGTGLRQGLERTVEWYRRHRADLAARAGA